MVRSIFVLVLTAAIVATASARADTVYLVNGDTIRGDVVSLDGKELKLKGELLGTLTIPRDKIRAIALGDQPLPGGSPSVDAQLKTGGIDPQAFRAAERLVPGAAPTQPGSADEAVRQLQTEGLDPGVKKQIEQAFPLLGSSGAGQYFNDTVTGLTTGQLNLEDLRRDALKARDQILDLQRDMDPQARSALAPYLDVLNRFLKETEPAVQPSQPTQPPTETPKR